MYRTSCGSKLWKISSYRIVVAVDEDIQVPSPSLLLDIKSARATAKLHGETKRVYMITVMLGICMRARAFSIVASQQVAD